jgi:hypothetical protein
MSREDAFSISAFGGGAKTPIIQTRCSLRDAKSERVLALIVNYFVATGKQIVVLYPIGMTGFEPAAPSSRTKCATKLRHIPP